HPAVATAIDQAEVLSRELNTEIGVSAIAGRDVVLLAGRGPAPIATSVGYPGDRSPLLAPFGAVFMAWADEAAVSAWLQRAGGTGAAADPCRRVLADIRRRGFSVPLQSIAPPAVVRAMERMRSEPADEEAEHHLTGVLQQADGTLLLFDGLSVSDQVT